MSGIRMAARNVQEKKSHDLATKPCQKTQWITISENFGQSSKKMAGVLVGMMNLTWGTQRLIRR